MASDPTQFLAHRLTVGRAVAVLIGVVSAAGVLDVLRRGDLRTYASAVCLLLALPAGAYVLGIRPAVLEGPAAIEVRNPLRTTVVPWDALDAVDVVDVLRLRARDREVRCFAVPRRRPPMTAVRSAMSTGFMLPPKDPGRGWEPPRGQSRAQALAERLVELSVQQRRRGTDPAAGSPAPGAGPGSSEPALTTRWAPDALVAVALVVVLVAAALVIR